MMRDATTSHVKGNSGVTRRIGVLVVVSSTLAGAVLGPHAANAAMAVFDGTLIGKAVEQIKEAKSQLATQLEQLSKLKEQLGFLNDISKLSSEIQSAIGSVSSISLPIPDISKLAAQVRSDARCLIPDGTSWGIGTKDLNLGSICATSSKYKDALFIDDGKMNKDGKSFAETQAAWTTAQKRRDALLGDSAVRALAQADVQVDQAKTVNAAADQLQTQLNSAQTVQDRLTVGVQAQILTVRTLAQTNQMLAQLLKLQAAGEIKRGLSPSQVVNPETTEEK